MNRPPLPNAAIDYQNTMPTTKRGERALFSIAKSPNLKQAIEAANMFGKGGELLIRFNQDGSVKFMQPMPFMENEKDAC